MGLRLQWQELPDGSLGIGVIVIYKTAIRNAGWLMRAVSVECIAVYNAAQ